MASTASSHCLPLATSTPRLNSDCGILGCPDCSLELGHEDLDGFEPFMVHCRPKTSLPRLPSSSSSASFSVNSGSVSTRSLASITTPSLYSRSTVSSSSTSVLSFTICKTRKAFARILPSTLRRLAFPGARSNSILRSPMDLVKSSASTSTVEVAGTIAASLLVGAEQGVYWDNRRKLRRTFEEEQYRRFMERRTWFIEATGGIMV